jgi:hypothetical protein
LHSTIAVPLTPRNHLKIGNLSQQKMHFSDPYPRSLTMGEFSGNERLKKQAAGHPYFSVWPKIRSFLLFFMCSGVCGLRLRGNSCVMRALAPTPLVTSGNAFDVCRKLLYMRSAMSIRLADASFSESSPFIFYWWKCRLFSCCRRVGVSECEIMNSKEIFQ